MEEEELNLEDFGDFDDLSEAETIDGTLTFDEILEDDYYNAEFEKRVQQRLEDIKNNSTGGQQPMDEQVQTRRRLLYDFALLVFPLRCLNLFVHWLLSSCRVVFNIF